MELEHNAIMWNESILSSIFPATPNTALLAVLKVCEHFSRKIFLTFQGLNIARFLTYFNFPLL